MSAFELLKEWDISITDSFSKYQPGKKTDLFDDIKSLKPVFSFDYVSINKSEFCFDGRLLGLRDYTKLIKALKEISAYTYSTLQSEYRFHFHDLKWNEVSISESDFYKCIHKEQDGERDITPYQFKVFEEARIIGFLYRGVFYLVMFDRRHKAYKRKDKKKR